MSPTAQADPTTPVIPSKQAIADAQQKVLDGQSSVASIEGQLAAADAQLANLGVAAGKAAEAYDGAAHEWQLAEKACNSRQGAGGASHHCGRHLLSQPCRVCRQP